MTSTSTSPFCARWVKSCPLDPTIPVPIRDANDIVVAQTAILGEAEFLCTIDDDFYEPVIMQFLQRFGIAVISDEDLIHRIRS